MRHGVSFPVSHRHHWVCRFGSLGCEICIGTREILPGEGLHRGQSEVRHALPARPSAPRYGPGVIGTARWPRRRGRIRRDGTPTMRIHTHRSSGALTMTAAATLLMLMAFANPSQAAPITVNYTINPGGTATGIFNVGTITGGTVSFSSNLTAASNSAILLQFKLIGTQGTVSPAIAAFKSGHLTPFTAQPPSGSFGAWLTATAGNYTYTRVRLNQFGVKTATISALAQSLSQSNFVGSFTITGTETLVPEPSQGALVLMGLVGLAGAGGALRRVRRR